MTQCYGKNNRLDTDEMEEIFLAGDTIMHRQIAIKLLLKIFLHVPTFIQPRKLNNDDMMTFGGSCNVEMIFGIKE